MTKTTNVKLSDTQDGLLKFVIDNDGHLPYALKNATYQKLVDLGLITRFEFKENRNKKHVTLTDAGREYARERGWLAAPVTEPAPTPEQAVSDAPVKALDAVIALVVDQYDDNPLAIKANKAVDAIGAELDAKDARIAALESERDSLRAVLEAVANNAPQSEPERYMSHSRAASIAWSFWVAGVKAKEALAKLTAAN